MNSYGSSDYPIPQPEDAEEWKSPSFSGDFYREADNVCRGVTLAPGGIPGASSYKDFVPLDGDFYREPDDICKGISLGGGSYPLAPSPFEKELGLSQLDYSSSLRPKFDVVNTERFQEADVPPPAPVDSFFEFEVTTLYATSHVPFEIGNSVLDFLTGQVVSTLTKVRRAKFSIKADVFVDSMMCTVKMRVYSQGSGQFAIEFQRRSGDTLCFNTIFQQASDYLKRQHHMNVGASAQVPSPLSFQQLPTDHLLDSIDEVDLVPLLDMASLVNAPRLQAEAATSLSQMAAEGKPAVRSSRVFQCIAELMQKSSTDVAFPTACLLSHLAQQSEAAPLFASHGLLPKLLEKIRSEETDVQVRHKCAQALSAATQWQSGATLPQHDAATLVRELSETLRTKDARWGIDVIQNLEMAQLALAHQFEG